MKKLRIILAVLTTSFTAFAQLQNPSFEYWDYPINENNNMNKPTGWLWTVPPYTDPTMTFFNPPSTDAQSGNYAMTLSVWFNTSKDMATQIAPINYRPANLKGYYKYEQNLLESNGQSVVDTAMVSIKLTKWSVEEGKDVVVGSGHVELLGAADFVEFTVPIDYISNDIPENVIVVLDPSILHRNPPASPDMADNGYTSYFTVDNISLEGDAELLGIHESESDKAFVYPNPVKDVLYFGRPADRLTIFDQTGRIVKQVKSSHTENVEISSLQSGTYLLVLHEGEKTSQHKFVKL